MQWHLSMTRQFKSLELPCQESRQDHTETDSNINRHAEEENKKEYKTELWNLKYSAATVQCRTNRSVTPLNQQLDIVQVPLLWPVKALAKHHWGCPLVSCTGTFVVVFFGSCMFGVGPPWIGLAPHLGYLLCSSGGS